MLSKEQAAEKEKKILKCVRTFLKSNGNIQEVSKITGIPTSSVQRYLNEKETILERLGNDIYEAVQEQLRLNKEEGLSRGGKVTTSRYSYLRDNSGKYTKIER